MIKFFGIFSTDKRINEKLTEHSHLTVEDKMLQKLQHVKRRLESLSENFSTATQENILPRTAKLVDYFNDARNYLYNTRAPLTLPSSPEMKLRQFSTTSKKSENSDRTSSSKPRNKP